MQKIFLQYYFYGDYMYFDELKVGMTVDTAPAVIKKEKMMEFARDYGIAVEVLSSLTGEPGTVVAGLE